MTRKSVVLPEPEGPSSASNVPWGTSRLMLSRAVKLPKDFVTFLIRMLMVALPQASLCEELLWLAPFARVWSLQSKSRLRAALTPRRPQKIPAGCILERVFLSATASYPFDRQYGRIQHRRRQIHRSLARCIR